MLQLLSIALLLSSFERTIVAQEAQATKTTLLRQSGGRRLQGSIVGYFDSYRPTSGSSSIGSVNGWACQIGLQQSIQVELWVGQPAPQGTKVRTVTANRPAESAILNICGSGSYRYEIPVFAEDVAQYGGQRIYVHGVNGGIRSDALRKSGVASPVTLPSPPPVGSTGGIQYRLVGADTDRFYESTLLNMGNGNVESLVRYRSGGAPWFELDLQGTYLNVEVRSFGVEMRQWKVQVFSDGYWQYVNGEEDPIGFWTNVSGSGWKSIQIPSRYTAVRFIRIWVYNGGSEGAFGELTVQGSPSTTANQSLSDRFQCTDLPQNAWLHLMNLNSNSGLHIYGATNRNGANAVIYNAYNAPTVTHDDWRLERGSEPGFFKLIVRHSGLSLGVSAGNGINGNVIQTNASADHEWCFVNANDIAFKIIHKGTGLALTAVNGNRSNGSNVAVVPYNSERYQMWKVLPAPA